MTPTEFVNKIKAQHEGVFELAQACDVILQLERQLAEALERIAAMEKPAEVMEDASDG